MSDSLSFSRPFSQLLARTFTMTLGGRGSLALGLLACGLSACVGPAHSAAPGYEIVGEDLEPFRSAFNAASEDVRAVLLVGPT